MSSYRTRLERIMSAAAGRIDRGGPSIDQMTDDELAELIGGPGCKAEDLTDEQLECIAGE
ncbi:MAG: hypothetical protein RBS80_31785 [Thermoguttaceae bacterium]|jgi:hypothetical protein|nr:hypothetical protein [Thermoguttaceae bacterium]